jgi:hypothetical protein
LYGPFRFEPQDDDDGAPRVAETDLYGSTMQTSLVTVCGTLADALPTYSGSIQKKRKRSNKAIATGARKGSQFGTPKAPERGLARAQICEASIKSIAAQREEEIGCRRVTQKLRAS